MDHSISSVDLLPKALSPSTPSSRNRHHLLFNPTASPHPHWTPPPTSPKHTNKILSTHLTHPPSTPDRPKSALASNITRTQSVDLLGLYDHHTPRPPISRSKSTTAIHHRDQTDHQPQSAFSPSDDQPHHHHQQKHQSKATKSILKRPNSPSKGTRARFFSPRVLSDPTGDEESDGNEASWVDEHGNCRGREIIHEFQKDEPPMTRPKQQQTFNQPPQSPSPPRKTAPTPSSASTTRRHHHTPKFIIPEPIDLGIEPILPRHSTSPSPSPPSLPPASYLMNARAHRKSTQQRSVSNSLIFNAPDNLSNILDESGGFLVGNETTWTGGDSKEPSTELSIDLNHVAMMELLGKKNLAKLRPGSAFAKHTSTTRGSDCIMEEEEEEEEEESVDVSGLARQLEDEKSVPTDNLALKDEQAPVNLRGSPDFSTTFESSKIHLPPLPTDRDELWKNSQPKEPMKKPASAPRAKRYSMSSVDHRILCERGEVQDEVTARLKKKIDSIKLSAQEEPRSVTKDDLFSELMSAPPPSLVSQGEKKTGRPVAAPPKAPKLQAPVPSSERRPTAAKRLSGPDVVAFPGGKPTEGKMTATNPVGKPRTSCISTSVVPVRAKRLSNIGIGLPPSTSAPAITPLVSKLSRPSTAALTGVRTKLKPSNNLGKPGLPSGSPKTMKSRSSLSTISLNSPRLRFHASPAKPSLLAHGQPDEEP
ncbi:hypothetical protein PtA15_4A46 [Puccinia triticina]|uniref:Uncharacterized protein n=1 Tax=Puccinia triticina TaxID=208348 RepID=A0ABY7CFD0_9BASI|nr:uncharacterized protein PtA15_4A46 [Puccinia triticina]WAQ83598.1 hypothetical protein PtA15_4A46 [Puccinia triticina]